VSGSGISCQHPTAQFFYTTDALPATQPTVSKHWRQSDTYQSDNQSMFKRPPLSSRRTQTSRHIDLSNCFIWITNVWSGNKQTILTHSIHSQTGSNLVKLGQWCKTHIRTRNTSRTRSVGHEVEWLSVSRYAVAGRCSWSGSRSRCRSYSVSLIWSRSAL